MKAYSGQNWPDNLRRHLIALSTSHIWKPQPMKAYSGQNWPNNFQKAPNCIKHPRFIVTD